MTNTICVIWAAHAEIDCAIRADDQVLVDHALGAVVHESAAMRLIGQALVVTLPCRR